MNYENNLSYALSCDEQDELKSFRSKFHFPTIHNKQALYFTGNSLGLQPKTAKAAIIDELDSWANLGVEGHFHGKNPWFEYHHRFKSGSAMLVGAKESEVVLMNTLTANLHFLMVSFYQPKRKRIKIICEAKAFPSDQYALETQVKFHGLDPKEALIEVGPREGEHLIHQEDIIAAIEKAGDELALVMIGGMNYYTGQKMDMQRITEAGHKVGAKVGFDLAHAVGNVKLDLHKWQVDFACWCTYKYLNSGPGSIGGIFVHEKHGNNNDLPRFAGWWGYDQETRFLMEPGFVPMQGADGWQLSNAPVMALAPIKSSLDIFEEAGMEKLLAKQAKLTGYLEFLVNQISDEADGASFEIITPKDSAERGCQLSILVTGKGKELFDYLVANSVIGDWREPNVIRIAPVPLYNSFEDVYQFGQILKAGTKNC
jgi:kynureninase